MKLPLSWLKEWVDPALEATALASRLTLAGFEVESCTAAAPAFTGVVVAEILEASRHPQADKLQVCRVSTGGGEPLQIVCGAPNARAGIKVALAQVGARLPGELSIKAAKLRGVESFGMLCSARELGLAVPSEGILELDANLALGMDLRVALDLDDAILEVSVYPNRGDAMSVRGLAREVSALLRVPLREGSLATATVASNARHEVRVEAPAAAPRFVSRVIRGVDNTRPTPEWMQERLRRSGLRPISPIVDVTNYVMLELGQPMHAYDRQLLRGQMHVRWAGAGETLRLLDGRDIALEADVLVIADGDRAIGLAGVMGGEGTAITPDVREVLLEVAYFAPEAIVGRARRYGLQTDASQRFERGVDPCGQRAAMERATALMIEICGGEAGPLVECADEAAVPRRAALLLRRSSLARLVGTALPDAEVSAALKALQMQVEAVADGWRVTPPSWRFDIGIEPDLVEEAIRVIGYDRVPETPARLPQRFRPRPESQVQERVLLDALVARGYHEAVNYAFVDPVLQGRLFPDRDPVHLANPIAADLSVMRVSLWPGLLKCAVENLRRQQDRVRLFEIGSVFEREGGAVREPRHIAAVAAGPRNAEQWGLPRDGADFFDIKSDVMALLDLSNDAEAFDFKAESIPCLHPGRGAVISRDGQAVGWVGELHPAIVRELDLPVAPLLFELVLAPATRLRIPGGSAVSRFPQVRRDLSVTLPESTPLRALSERVTVAAGSLLRDLRIFDIYQGPGIESGRKSIAFGLIFQDNKRTLTDEDADRLMAGITAELRGSLDAKVRE